MTRTRTSAITLFGKIASRTSVSSSCNTAVDKVSTAQVAPFRELQRWLKLLILIGVRLQLHWRDALRLSPPRFRKFNDNFWTRNTKWWWFFCLLCSTIFSCSATLLQSTLSPARKLAFPSPWLRANAGKLGLNGSCMNPFVVKDLFDALGHHHVGGRVRTLDVSSADDPAAC